MEGDPAGRGKETPKPGNQQGESRPRPTPPDRPSSGGPDGSSPPRSRQAAPGERRGSSQRPSASSPDPETGVSPDVQATLRWIREASKHSPGKASGHEHRGSGRSRKGK